MLSCFGQELLLISQPERFIDRSNRYLSKKHLFEGAFFAHINLGREFEVGLAS